MNIYLDSGERYSTDISDEEWNAFLTAANGNMTNGFTVPREVLEKLWEPEHLNGVQRVVIWRKL